jgi:hypothetical protein
MTETTTSISKYGIPTLTGIDNYYEWKSATQDAILAMGALEVITLDKKEKPKALASEGVRSTRTEVATPTSAEVSLYLQLVREYQSWMDKDQRVMGVLRMTLSHGIKMEIEQCTCAKDIWDKLVQIHQLNAKEYQADVQEELHGLGMTEGDDPMKFMEKFSSVLLKAETAGIKMDIQDKAVILLRSLPVSYAGLKDRWNMKVDMSRIMKLPEPTFEDLRAMFNAHVTEMGRQDKRIFATAMMVKSGYKDKRVCWNCGKAGHSKRECRQGQIGDGYTYKDQDHGNNRKPAGYNRRHQERRDLDDLAALHRNMAG